ncbi:MAG: MATE family efflux transporter [Clostridia bacterium]|nr:MATE family efflux transporter [Clostridia bacterium]
MTLDMTRGKPAGLLIRFALPMIFSSLLQQLYTMCDSMIVGRLLGTNAFAAVGSASYLHWFPLSMLLGATAGFGVALSQRFGAKDEEGLRSCFAASIVLTMVIGGVFTLLGTTLLEPLLLLVDTPRELMPHSISYIRVLWAGLLLTAALNILSAALRATGDSRTPFIALIISTIINIALDYVLIAGAGMGADGAALATVLSQAAAAAWCLRAVARMHLLPARRHYRLQRAQVLELLRLGMPQLLSQGVIATGEMAVLSAINSFGVAFVTGNTAARRYFSLFNVVGGALESAVGTFVGQNWGANERKRAAVGTRTAVAMGLSSSVTIAALIMLGAPALIRLFIPDGGMDALRIGIDALRAEVLFLPALYLLCEHRASIQGMGNAFIPMVSGFLELALRIAAAQVMPALFGSAGLYFTDAVTWTVTAVMLIISYRVIIRRSLRGC